MTNKYNIDISTDDYIKNVQRLTNQIWKLIPMKEQGEEWEKQLSTTILEIVGLERIFSKPNLLQMLSKMEGLLERDAPFDLFRKTIFECISLLRERD